MLCLPADWKIDARNDPRWIWPMKWLWFLAKYPRQFDTFLFVSHTIPNSEGCDPFGPGTSQCCWFIRAPLTTPEAFHELTFGDRTISFLAMTAIYRWEMEFAISNDMDSLYGLAEALAEAGVTELVDPTRAELSAKHLKQYLGRLPTE